VPPNVGFTNVDPGAFAAVASSFPHAKQVWCLWHIYHNHRKNRESMLGDKYRHFCSDFKAVQQQLSRDVFQARYERLRELW